MQSFLKTGLFLFLGGLNAIAEVQLVKSTKAHIAKKNGTAHTLQKRTAQGTHRNDHPEPCNCSPIGRQWPNGQLAAGGKNQLRLLGKNIHFSAVLRIFLGNILKREKGGASYDQICISTLGPGNKRGTNTWWAKSFEEHLHPGLTTPAMDFKS